MYIRTFILGLASVAVTLSVCISSDRSRGSELSVSANPRRTATGDKTLLSCSVLMKPFQLHHFCTLSNSLIRLNRSTISAPLRRSAEREREKKAKTQMCTFLLPFILCRHQSCCQLLLSDEEQECDRYDVEDGKEKLLCVLSVSDDRRVHRSNHNTERHHLPPTARLSRLNDR